MYNSKYRRWNNTIIVFFKDNLRGIWQYFERKKNFTIIRWQPYYVHCTYVRFVNNESRGGWGVEYIITTNWWGGRSRWFKFRFTAPIPLHTVYRQQGTGTTRGHHPRYRATYCTLGWSDLALLAIFKFGHMLSISFIFFSSIPKKSISLAACTRVARFWQF